MAKVIVFGVGQIAEVAQFYLTHDSPHQVVAFTVDEAFRKQSEHRGVPVVAFEEVQHHYPPDEFRMFVPLSYRRCNRLRAQKYAEAKAKGYELVSYVSTRATVWPGLAVGDNCFILENNVIQPFVHIGSDVVLWSGNHLGHHSTIKDHCFLASHVIISGSVTVEPYCFFGVNATVRDGITIARECVIGAGALVMKDTVERGVYLGGTAKLFSKTSDALADC